MKKMLLLPFFAATVALGQNGLTVYPIPGSTSFRTCINSDNAGNVYVGFNTGGVMRKFDGTSWTAYDASNSPITNSRISTIGVQNGNLIWVGTYATNVSGQLLLFDGTNWTNHSADVGGYLPKCVITGNAPNIAWVGTSGGGLYKFDGLGWNHYTVANSGLASDTVNSLALDPSGNLLAGTTRGLSIENGASWSNFNSQNTPGLSGDNISSVYSDGTNGTWLMTGTAIGKFSGNTFVPVNVLFPSAVENNGSGFNSLGKGPHGGVVCRYAGSTLTEFTGNFPNSYFYSGNIFSSYFTYNTADSKTWFVGFSGNNNLYAFDGNGYAALSSSPSPVNARLLDVNSVSAGILNRGDMHWNTQNSKYEVPKGGGAGTIFASDIWIGGLDPGNNLHMAAMTYRQSGMDFFPGPLDTTNGTTDTLNASQYDYIWKIDKTEILAFQYYWSIGAVQNGTYVPGHDFLTWPAQGTGNYTRDMAPFVDVNGNGIYDPLTGGDYPDIKGDQMLYCIYNDNLAAHTETAGGQPLKVEVHFSAYAYNCSSVADSLKVINYTTFYNYKIYNRSSTDYHDMRIGLFQDADLGAYDDDFVGCFPQGNFAYTYNGDMNDGTSALPTVGTYGQYTPISSLAILDGPVAATGDTIDNDNDGLVDEPGEKNLMTGFAYYNNDFQGNGNPYTAHQYYNYLSGRWADSTFMTYGGSGYGGITPTRFMFPNWPFDASSGAWSERTAGDTPFDRRYVVNCGTFDFPAGAMVNLDFADVFSRDSFLTPADSGYFLQAWYDVNRIRSWYANNNAPSCVQWNVAVPEQAKEIQFSLYPNPASTQLTLEYQPQSDKAYYEIIDLTGRVIARDNLAQQGMNFIPVGGISPGIYFVRIVDGTTNASQKFIRQ